MKDRLTKFCLAVVLGFGPLSALAQPPGSLQRCVALRSGGSRVWAQFGSLANIVERRGLIDGIAGGGSATLTAFLYDSILDSPLVRSQPAEPKRQRAALLLKSVYGMMEVLEDRGLRLILGDTNDPQNRELLLALPRSEEEASAAAYAFAFQNFIPPIINPKFIEYTYPFGRENLDRQQQAIEAIRNLDTPRAATADPLVRPGLFQFKTFAYLASWLADFYALRPAKPAFERALESWLNRCAGHTSSLSWQQIAQSDSTAVSSCKEEFLDLALPHLERNATPAQSGSFGEEPIGKNIEVIIGTGLIQGHAAAQTLENLKDQFVSGESVKTLGIPFADFHFGYWTSTENLLETIEFRLPLLYPRDLKSQKFWGLTAGVSWNKVLEHSPAEPGLSAARKIDSESYLYSTGGWADTHPVQVLDAAGCQETIYLTRAGEESDFTLDLVRLFADGENFINDIYSLSLTSVSSFASALNKAAGGVVCTDWDNQRKFPGASIMALGEEGYAAPIVEAGSADNSIPIGCRPTKAPERVVGTRLGLNEGGQ